MTYTINKSDGTRLADVLDGTIDQTTDLKLIGKNYTSFGESLNENLVYLLENFSNSSPPTRPLTGQVWYNTSTLRLEVYTGSINGWRPAGAPIVSSGEPTNLVSGDFWINTIDKQLYFYDGYSLTLAGQPWTKSQGVTGFVAKTVYDINNNYRSILQLYVKDTLLGIFSAESFTLSETSQISGFSNIQTGYTASTVFNSLYDIKSLDSQKLNGLTSNSFLRSDDTPDPITNVPNTRSIMSVPLSITSSSGLTIGPTSNVTFKTEGLTLQIENTVHNGNISLRTTRLDGVSKDNNIFINSSTGFVGILTSQPQRQLDINGSMRVQGTLEVTGKILTAPIELTLLDNDISGHPTIGIICSGTAGSSILSMPTSNGVYEGMDVTGSSGLGDNPKVIAVNPTQVTLSVNNVENISGTLIFTDNQTIRDNTALILEDIAPTQYYLPNQLALVHYQRINFDAKTVSRYLKRFVIQGIIDPETGILNESWKYDVDLQERI